MARSGFRTARLSDLTRNDGWAPIRRSLGIHGFGINAWTADAPGATLIPEHDERPSRHEELYLVISGQATFTVNGEVIDAPAGTIVFVEDPDLLRGGVAARPATTVLSVGAAAGRVFAPRSWEMNRDVFALLDAGESAAARKLLIGALGEYGDQGDLLYNLACAEAQLGETDAALEHLRGALEANPSLAPTARQDADLEPLRSNPRFAELLR